MRLYDCSQAPKNSYLKRSAQRGTVKLETLTSGNFDEFGESG